MSKENLRDGELSANNVDTYTSVSHQDTLPSNLSLLRLRGCQVKHQDVVVREVEQNDPDVWKFHPREVWGTSLHCMVESIFLFESPETFI